MTASSTTTTYAADNLIAGSSPDIANDTGTLILGQNLARGAVLGRITASAKLTACNNGAVDGSQKPIGILVEAIDATAADKTCQIYVAGCFRSSVLVWHASFDTVAEKTAAFDGTAIVLR